MATPSDTSAQAKAVMPVLTVDDLQKSITFFEGLGFTIGQRWENGGTLIGAMMVSGLASVGLSQDDWKKGKRAKGEALRLFITTGQNIDELATRARAAGATLDREPHDLPWGARAFEVTEPSGFKLTFAAG